MANRLSLARATILCGFGILDLCTSVRQYLKNTLAGFSPLIANTVSCLCLLNCCSLMLPTFLLYHALLLPLLTLFMQPLALNGRNVTVCSVHSFIISLILLSLK
ncbi:hypothetical protein CVT25_003494 [Psilocybe cyanescens]|uniref:Uncharacterized protein n=1 Tax=Psilocybe cyanescens TaxID=93625 RepID=A0A409XF38_PSICY|nr:hypothetical protein CVT25_003494 [Psilocybe cyanescens]